MQQALIDQLTALTEEEKLEAVRILCRSLNDKERKQQARLAYLTQMAGSVIGLDHIEMRCRKEEQVLARAFAMKVYRDEGLSLPAIGKIFGQNHATVLNSLRKIDYAIFVGNYETERQYKQFIKLIQYDNDSTQRLGGI